MLIGSRAITYWNPDFKIRSNSDWESVELPFEYKGVDSYGGEGHGPDFYSVILIRNPDNHDEQYYIKFQGWYASYNGAEYEGWSFVEPKQKTVTVYS